eukprot:1549134-Amphidinium_carterae.2
MRGRSRRVHIRKDVELRAYGYTVGCAGCEMARIGAPPRAHSEFCRQRIEGEMARDGSLTKRDEVFDERVAAEFERLAKRQATSVEGDAVVGDPPAASVPESTSPEAPAGIPMETEPPTSSASARAPVPSSPEKRVRSDSMESDMVDEELVRTADPSPIELRELSALCAVPYPEVRLALRDGDGVSLLEIGSVCKDLRRDMRVDHPLGREAILAEIRAQEPKLVIMPYMCESQSTFVGVVGNEQSCHGRKFAVCMLDDVSLSRDQISAPHTSQLPGSCVLQPEKTEKLLELETVPLTLDAGTFKFQKNPNRCLYDVWSRGDFKGTKRRELLGLLHALAEERPPNAAPYSS